MNVIKKIVSMLLCVCMSGYALPVFAQSTVVDAEAQMVMLTDSEMGELTGAGSVDAKLADHAQGENAVVVFANRSTLTSSYSLEETNASGGVLNVLTTGSLAAGEAVVVSEPITLPAGGYALRATITADGFEGITSVDTFMH